MKWYLGGSTTRGTSAANFYSAERSSTVPSGASSSTTGEVGLAYPSDYGYTFANGVESCFSSGLNNCNNDASKSWMYKSGYHWWLQTPETDLTYLVFCVTPAGQAYECTVTSNTNIGVRPVVYLKSNIGITGGSGTKTDPYTVGTVS